MAKKKRMPSPGDLYVTKEFQTLWVKQERMRIVPRPYFSFEAEITLGRQPSLVIARDNRRTLVVTKDTIMWVYGFEPSKHWRVGSSRP